MAKTKKRSPNKKWHNWCDFGEHYIEEDQSRKHVYPIPVCDAFPDGGWNGEGATACNECYPAIYDLQVEQEIMLVNVVES